VGGTEGRGEGWRKGRRVVDGEQGMERHMCVEESVVGHLQAVSSRVC
jgi:hypothetical protein